MNTYKNVMRPRLSHFRRVSSHKQHRAGTLIVGKTCLTMVQSDKTEFDMIHGGLKSDVDGSKVSLVCKFIKDGEKKMIRY
jgi:hypothetical protein